MKAWTQITLWKRVMLGLVLGLAVGLAVRYGLGAETATSIGDTWFKPFGDGFVRLIKMLVVPLIFTTLVAGVTAMGDPSKLGSLGGRAIALYMGTTFIAVIIGLLMGTIFQPGIGVEILADASAQSEVSSKIAAGQAADASFADKILAIIPTNPAEALAAQDVLGIIFFAIIFGVGCLMAGDKAKPVSSMLEAAAEVMMKVTVLVMELAPIGVFFLMAWVMATKGIDILFNLGLLTIALYLACAVHIILVYGLGIVKGILGLPVLRFFGGIRDAQAVAYSTASSAGTLPVTIANVSENLGVKKSVAASVLPVGATVNMDGTAIYLGLVALFAAQALGIDMTPAMYLSVALGATLTSIGAAAIPSAGLLLASAVLISIGVTEEQSLLVIAMIFPFDRLLDMMRTMTNVTGDAAVACTVAKWEGELDEATFRHEATI
ncbi:MAG: dicarboxylate/amino acid:cation symporter [Ponticaulis sp.]|nr:dicarboxylate/amino acid:cation symporter [Ponticaulis sp.]|tara:strand:- start:13445 stop:14749 length:1305 start_codon:yes stop_codon:yes gene_type:complete